MSTADHLLRNAEECLQMAEHSRRDKDRGAWLRLAESWLRLVGNTEPSPHFAWRPHRDEGSQVSR